MMEYKNWYQHFEVRLKGVKTAFERSGSELSLLGFALKENYLSSQEYLEWAISQFQLPFLQANFFIKTPPKPDLLSKWNSVFNWSKECFPVGEWDDVLLVAGIHPPQGLPTSPQCVFVLASFDILENTWLKMNQVFKYNFPKTPSAENQTRDLSFGPEGLDLSIPARGTTSTKVNSDMFSFEDLNLLTNEQETSPEHLQSELTSLREDLTKHAKLKVNLQTGLHTNPHIAKLTNEKTFIAPPILKKLDDENPEPIVPSLDQLKKESTDDPLENHNSASSNIIPLKFDAIPPIPKVHNVSPRTAGHFTLQTLELEQGSKIHSKMNNIFEKMKSHFKKSLILSLNEKEYSAKVFACDPSFDSTLKDDSFISLEDPSIFRIVASTQKPYHGYISLNEINESFFQTWTHGVIPDHVTIVPINYKDSLVGMLMGVADKSAYNKASLNLAEQLASELSTAFKAA